MSKGACFLLGDTHTHINTRAHKLFPNTLDVGKRGRRGKGSIVESMKIQ